MDLLKHFDQTQLRKDLTIPQPGDIVRIHQKIKEKDKERIQIFEGTVLGLRGSGASRNFTVRKISFDVAVEKVFPLHSPTIAKIEVIRHLKVRRAKLYYLRDRFKKAKKGQEIAQEQTEEKIESTEASKTSKPEKN